MASDSKSMATDIARTDGRTNGDGNHLANARYVPERAGDSTGVFNMGISPNRALTVRQPYANRLVRGEKLVENRSRPTSVRGFLVIHAGAQVHERYRGQTFDPMGAHVGVVRLASCHADRSQECVSIGCSPDTGAEFRDRLYSAPVYHWVMAEPVEFVTPIAAKGQLGFWEPFVTDEHLIGLAIREALENKERQA